MTPKALPIAGPSATDALENSYAHPRLTPRVFIERPATAFCVLAYKLKKAILSEDVGELKKAASAMTSDERYAALEQFEREDDIAKAGYWNPAHRKFDSPTPVERYNQDIGHAPAPAPRPTGPRVLEPEGTGWLRSAEVGAVVHFEIDGERHHGKIVAWGQRGARVVVQNGDVAAVAWKDLHAGVHPDSQAEYGNKVAKSREAALRRAWATLGPLENLSPAERFVKSRGEA